MALSSNIKKRVYELDGLRGVAAIWVGLHHFWGSIQGRDVDWVPQLISDFFEIGFFGVEIFFVLSGFVIMYSISGTAVDNKFVPRFMLRRSIRIDPPYWLAIGIVIFLMLLKQKYFPQENVNFPSYQSVAAHVFYLQDLIGFKPISSVFWTLCLEFQFYIIFSLIYFFYKKSTLFYRNVFEKLFVTIGLALCFVSPVLRFNSIDYIISGTILPFAYEFVLGVFAYFWIKGTLKTRTMFLAIFLIVVPTLYLKPFYYSLVPISVVFILFFSSRGESLSWFKSRIMLFFGRISYSFYLTHASIGWTSISLMSYLLSGYREDFVTFIIFFMGMFISIIVAAAFYIIIEKPSIIFSKKYKSESFFEQKSAA